MRGPAEVARRVLRSRGETWSAASGEAALGILIELGLHGAAEHRVWESIIQRGRYVAIGLDDGRPIDEVDPADPDWRAELVMAPAEPTRLYGSLRRQARRVLVVERGLLTDRQVRRAIKRVAGILHAGGVEVDVQRIAYLVLRAAEDLDCAPRFRRVRDSLWRQIRARRPHRARLIAYHIVAGLALLDAIDKEPA
jgi:hypothetical protein